MVWSPPSYSACRSQSIQASALSSTGLPSGEDACSTPANLSAPERANCPARCRCSAGRMLLVNEPAFRSTGQVVDVRDGLNVTSGGSSDSAAKDWQVKPAGPSGVEPVTTVRPLANVPKISRSRRGARSDVTVMEGPLVWIVTPPNHHQTGPPKPSETRRPGPQRKVTPGHPASSASRRPRT